MEIRARGKYVAAQLHQIQGEIRRVKRKLKETVTPEKTLFNGELSVPTKEFEKSLVVFLERENK